MKESDFSKDAAYSPAVYVKTAPGTVLAFMKALELVLGFFLLQGLWDDLSFSSILAGYGGPGEQLAAALPVIVIVLWMADSLSVIVLRLTCRFSAVIGFIHALIVLVMVLAVAAVVLGIVGMYVGLLDYLNTYDLSTYMSSLNFAYLSLIVADCGLSIGFHAGIVGIMHTISVERRTGRKRNVGKSVLPGVCQWLILTALLPLMMMVAYLIVSNMPDVPNREIIMNILTLLGRDEPSPVEIALAVASVPLVIELSAVKAWAKKYNRAHR